MNQQDKAYLLGLLAQTHDAIRLMLEDIDLELPVYSDSGWRIRDILAHIATWDHQAASSLKAYRVGQEYSTPGLDESKFNEQSVLEQRDKTGQQIFDEWVQARREFKRAVEEMPRDLFPGDLLYPWGDERGTIAYLVEMMTDHDIEHRDEIMKTIVIGSS
jgi:hypothetical protein